MGITLPRADRRRLTGPGTRAGWRLGLAGLILSVVATLVVAVAGVSVMEPALPGQPGQPPWALGLHVSPYVAVGLTATSLVSGTAGLVLLLRAVRAGWRMPPRILLLSGIAVAAALTLVPPFGSSDHLSYAAYGRMVIAGHNPWLTTPAQLAQLGDPVARAVQDWREAPSVYGPLATGLQALASLIGGTSVRLTVFILGLVNLIAFGATGAMLYRLTGRDQGRQLRAMLLWTANPLLLQVLVAGAHVDTQAIAFSVAAVAVFYGRGGMPTLPRAVLAGALVGCGAAIKVTGALIGLALAIALLQAGPLWQPVGYRRPVATTVRRAAAQLAGLAAGFVVVAAVAVAIGGGAMLHAESQASDMVSIGSPWRVIRSLLQSITGHSAATDIVKYGAVAIAIALAVLIARRGPPIRADECDSHPVRTGWLSQPSDPARAAQSANDAEVANGAEVASAGRARGPAAGRAAGRAGSGAVPVGVGWLLAAVTVGWLFAWPYVLPWYDALGWAFLALVPASNLDWLMLARTAALGFGYLPARTTDAALPGGLSWLQPVFRHAIAPAVLAVTVVWLAVWLLRSGRMRSGQACSDEQSWRSS